MKLADKKIHLSIIAVFAAIMAASHAVPAIPLIGVGGTFSVSTALFPLAGILFGPIYGALCAAIAGVIGQMAAPHVAWLGAFTFIVGTINAFAAGLVSRGKWIYAATILAVGTLLWFSNPIGKSVPQFAISFYGLGFIAIVVGGIFAKKWFVSDNPFLQTMAIFLCAFSGFASTASIANYLSLIIFKTPAEVWTVLAVVSPMERCVFGVATAVVGVPLLSLLPKVGILVGPSLAE